MKPAITFLQLLLSVLVLLLLSGGQTHGAFAPGFLSSDSGVASDGSSSDDTSTEEPDYVKEIEQQYRVIDDPSITSRVEAIRSRLLAMIPEAAMDERKVVVRVLDDPMVNAFSLPDGHVYLFKGLLDKCETDDMLAGVMAHEFTHIFHRHHSRMGERELRGMLIGLIAMAASGQAEGAILGEMLAATMVETYGRSAEIDADKTGVVDMVRAGYDPLGYLELLQVLEQEAIHEPQLGGNYFTIHPDPADRMASIREALAAVGIQSPETIYRVHLPVEFYTPLTEAEAAQLSTWEAELKASPPSGEKADEPGGEGSDAGPSSEAEQIPPVMLNQLRLRSELFHDIVIPSGRSVGVVTVGGKGIFYLSEASEEGLVSRADGIISGLGDLFLAGLRNYEVQAATLSDGPALIARRRTIAYTTPEDADLLGGSAQEVNARRVGKLKDILLRYFVNRRI